MIYIYQHRNHRYPKYAKVNTEHETVAEVDCISKYINGHIIYRTYDKYQKRYIERDFDLLMICEDHENLKTRITNEYPEMLIWVSTQLLFIVITGLNW